MKGEPCHENFDPEASSYIRIIIAGLMATSLYNVCAAVLRSIGDSFTPLVFLVIANLLNIGLDYLFVYGLYSGVAGAAAATVVAQALPAAICILRNSMQGFGDTRTPLISSLIELAGKVLIAFLLAPVIGYMGVIVAEPLVWALMVVPLLVGMRQAGKKLA